MANQGWTNQAGGGVQTSSTARTTGRGEMNASEEWVTGERIADPGEHNDPLSAKSDQFGANGQLSVC